MNHKQKTKMARKMRSRKEVEHKLSIWGSKAWRERKDARRKKVENKLKK